MTKFKRNLIINNKLELNLSRLYKKQSKNKHNQFYKVKGSTRSGKKLLKKKTFKY